MWNRLLRLMIGLLGLLLALELVSRLTAEILWFAEVEYIPTFTRRLTTQVGLWVVVCSSSAFFLLGNLRLAARFKYPNSSESEEQGKRGRGDAGTGGRGEGFTEHNNSPPQSQRDSPHSSLLTPHSDGGVRLRLLLPVVLGGSLLVSLMLFHYAQAALNQWPPDYSLPDVMPPLPPPFELASTERFWSQFSEQNWQVGVLAGIVILLLLKPQFWLSAIAVGISLVFGLVLSENWARVLQYFSPTAFEQLDPVFGRDISFYTFRVPLWELLDFWLGGLFLYGLVAVCLVYLLSGDSLSQGKFAGFSRPQLRHLYALGSIVMLALALRHGLSRYELLYSRRGVVHGASYTDVNVQLPVETGLSITAAAIALGLLWTSLIRFRHRKIRVRTPLIALGVYLAAVILGISLNAVVQTLSVDPDELELERPYIERSIAFTRAAFGLDEIESRIFDPRGELSAADIRENALTIRNIRLWDVRPLLQSNRQLQRLRPYYEFPNADIDRYTLKVETSPVLPPANQGQQADEQTRIEKQQTIIAARELDYDSVPGQAQTWINKHFAYTHGYGFTLSPVNQISESGVPEYFVRGIGTGQAVDEVGTLRTSSEYTRNSIPIGKPRIYYGEQTDTYVMAPTRVEEFDFPSREENFYNTYDGNGGIPISSPWRQWLFTEYFKDWRMPFTQNFTPQTRLLFRRNIERRVRAIAPFLRYDRDPYLVTARVEEDESNQNHLHWIIDAYTTSDRYPYSDPGNNEFNYIRNSVKIVIDAYNGDVDFYVIDPNDPVIATWSKIFPNLFQPFDDMPATLRSHIRYPIDLFSTQSEQLLTYHMSDPRVFYNQEDQWQIPTEIYQNESQTVAPYYLILKLPTATEEEFILLHSYTPISRNNLTAWLAGRSDPAQYGKLLLYQFPKQELVYGPKQIEALINQDPVISQQISLWNRQGSKVIQGNLLVIPIEQSLLYVEPLYLEAERNGLPTLARVIVVYENRIVMTETLQQAIQVIFQPNQQRGEAAPPAIIRTLDELAPALQGEQGGSE